MKQFNLKALVPHLVAAGIFLLVAIIFCRPSLESDTVLKQGDTVGWQGMSHQSMEYKEQHGHYPLWTTNMFGGMPGYQIAMEGDWSPLGYADRLIQLWLPQPINFFYLACICFYFLCICFGIRPYAAILGALAFAYCSYSPIIITAGHNTKMLALAYSPAVIGAAVMIFDKKYIAGFSLLALFTALQIGQSHQQITYYLFLILLFMAIAYTIRLISNKQSAHLVKSFGLLAIAGMIGIGVNAITLMTAFDFTKESKRGGQLVMDKNNSTKDAVKDGKTVGLSKDYAFMWSYGKAETWSLMFPGVMGYGTHIAERDGEQTVFPMLTEKSKTAAFLTESMNIPEDEAANFAMQQSTAVYWGDQPFTNGPVYLGAVICFLFILGMFLLDNKHKWWILSASIFAILLAWGDNFPAFNYFMFDHFPLYNKFRVPTMTLVIHQLLFPLMASMTVDKLSDSAKNIQWEKIKLAGIATAAVFVMITLFYFTADFSRENKKRTEKFNELYKKNDPSIEEKLSQLDKSYQPKIDNRLYEGMIANLQNASGAQKKAQSFVAALRKDRASFLLADILRSLIFVLIAGGIVLAYLKQKLNTALLIAGVTLVTLIDLLNFDSNYLNEKSFDSKEKYEANEFPITAADQKILEDKDPNFRVFNTSGLDESKTSYYHKSIGGYHPAKIGIYDDLLAYQLSGNPNVDVVNMLNAKYIIQQRGNEKVALQNPEALGNVWYVNAVKFVNGPVEEMKALDDFNPRDTAVVDEKYRSLVTNFTARDSADQISMTAFDNDTITYKSSGKSAHLAVFSEIFYKDWKVYIDGKPAAYFKANYVLRAMVVPAGEHTIQFRFEPAAYFTGRKISSISSWFLTILLLGVIIMQFIQKKKVENLS